MYWTTCGSVSGYHTAVNEQYNTYVISIRVLNEGQSIVCNLIHKLNALRLGSVVNTTLKHTASVTVGGDLDTISSNRVVNELVILRRQLIQAFLNDMVAVEILDEHDDVQAESDNDRVNLSASGEEVDHLLHGTCAVHIEGDVDQVLSNRLADEVTLLIGAELEKLLTQVIAEGVYKPY